MNKTFFNLSPKGPFSQHCPHLFPYPLALSDHLNHQKAAKFKLT